MRQAPRRNLFDEKVSANGQRNCMPGLHFRSGWLQRCRSVSDGFVNGGCDLKTFMCLTATLALSLAGGVAQAGIILNGAHLLSIDRNTGSYTNGNGIESTTGCCAGASLYVNSVAAGNLIAGSLSTGVDSGYTDLGYSLATGVTHFVLEGAGVFNAAPWGTDIFFNMPFGTGTVASQGPSITAYLNASNALTSGLAGSVQPNWSLNSFSLPNGGLLFSSGGQTVRLSNYASVVDANNKPANSFDLTLSSAVTGAPEPGTVWLTLAAATGFLTLRRRTRRA